MSIMVVKNIFFFIFKSILNQNLKKMRGNPVFISLTPAHYSHFHVYLMIWEITFGQ